jgi:Response regulator containing a CheY-like receiver domain and a GGDEF domain
MNQNPILLVEDNLSDIDLTRRAFSRARITNSLVVAQDGPEALDLLFGDGNSSSATVRPALILLDLKLPVLDGLEVLRRIRANHRTRRLPVVILTSSQMDEDIAASYELGVNSYIRKPVDFGQFADAVRQLGLYWLVMNESPPPPLS